MSTWSANNVQLIGTMLAGLTSAEIGTLALSTASTLSVAGTSTSFSSAQVRLALRRSLYKVTTVISTIETLRQTNQPCRVGLTPLFFN